MNIVHVLVGHANPEYVGGVNKVAHHLATQAVSSGHDVEVWGIEHGDGARAHDHTYRLVHFSGVASRGLARFRVSKDLKETVGSLPGNTVVHLHGVFNPELYALSRLLKGRDISWIFSPHGGFAPQNLHKKKFLKQLYLRLFENRLLRGARVILAVSPQEADDIAALTYHERIVVVRNGQDLAGLDADIAPTKPRPNPVFGFCGQLATQAKGLDLLLDGFAAYRNNGGTGELWLIGDGPDANALRDRARVNNTGASVRFLGPMFGQAKLNRIAQMDAFIHTSRWEGMPTAVLEAAGLSRPLLVSRQTNLGQFVTDYRSGVVLEENEPSTIARALRLLERKHGDGTLRAMGERALIMTEAEFDWGRVSEDLAEKAYVWC